MRMEVTMAVTKRCPYRDERDVGTVTLDLAVPVANDCMELYALAGAVEKVGEEPLSHEEYTRRLSKFAGVVSVTTRWRTGPWEVTCST